MSLQIDDSCAREQRERAKLAKLFEYKHVERVMFVARQQKKRTLINV